MKSFLVPYASRGHQIFVAAIEFQKVKGFAPERASFFSKEALSQLLKKNPFYQSNE